MREREPGYARLAGRVVDVDGLSVRDIVDRVLETDQGRNSIEFAELVPEVVMGDSRSVGVRDQVCASDRLQEEQVARLRHVQPGDEAGDHAGRVVRTENQLRPSMTTSAVAAATDCLQRAGHGRAHGDDAPSRAVRQCDQPRCVVWHRVPLGRGWFVQLRAGHAGMQRHRGNRDAGRDEAHQQVRGERTSRAWHLGAPRLRGVHVLAVGQGQVGGHVRVRDRPAMRIEVGEGFDGRFGGCDPQPRRAGERVGVRCLQGEDDATREVDHVAGHAVEVGTVVVIAPDLDDPARGVQPGREVHERAAAVSVTGAKCSRERRGRVDDEQVARDEDVGEVAKAVMRDAVRARHQQANAVAGGASPLRRYRRLAPRRDDELAVSDGEVSRGDHAGTRDARNSSAL